MAEQLTPAQKQTLQEEKDKQTRVKEEAAGAPNPQKPYGLPPQKKAKGGYVRSADGCAQRGKTKGKMV